MQNLKLIGMNKVDELKKQLQEAVLEEKKNSQVKELENLKNTCEGKCFATNTFERKNASTSVGVIHYENFFINEDKIYVFERYASAHRHNAFYKKSKTDCSFHRSHHERCLTNEPYTAEYNLYSGWSHFKHTITLDLFEQVWHKSEECYDLINELFSSKFSIIRTNAITQGDFSNERSIEIDIDILKLDIIDFTKYPEVHSVIEFKTLPTFQDRRWMPRVFAKQVLQYQVNLWKEELAKDYWMSSSQRGSVQRKIDVINNFINTKLK